MSRLIVLSSGLAGALAALAIRRAHPDRDVLLVEQGRRPGGGPAQPFFPDELDDMARQLIEDAVVRRWDGFQIMQNGNLQKVPRPVWWIAPEQVAADLMAEFSPSQIITSAQVGRVPVATTCVTVNGSEMAGEAVIDLRQRDNPLMHDRIELDLGSHSGEQPIELSAPVLADNSIMAGRIGSVLQYFPMDSLWLLVRRISFVREERSPDTQSRAPASGTKAIRTFAFPFEGPELQLPHPVPSVLLPSQVPAAAKLAAALAEVTDHTPRGYLARLEALRRTYRADGRQRLEVLRMLFDASQTAVGEVMMLGSQL